MGKHELTTAAEAAAIIKMTEAGMSRRDIMEITHRSQFTVDYVRRVVAAHRDGNADEIRRMAANERAKRIVTLACECLGATKLLEDPQREPDAPKKDVAAPTTPDNTALMWASMLEAIKEQTKAVEALNATVKAMQLTLQGFRGDVGEKAKSIVDAINYNSDQSDKLLDKCVGYLNSIRDNTRNGRYV